MPTNWILAKTKATHLSSLRFQCHNNQILHISNILVSINIILEGKHADNVNAHMLSGECFV